MYSQQHLFILIDYTQQRKAVASLPELNTSRLEEGEGRKSSGGRALTYPNASLSKAHSFSKNIGASMHCIAQA